MSRETMREATPVTTKLIVCEDNEAVIKIVLKQRSPAFRHVSRTHRVNLDWTYETMNDPNVSLKYVNTKYQIADMMTKAFTKKELWESLLYLSALGPSSEKRPGKTNTEPKADSTVAVANIQSIMKKAKLHIGRACACIDATRARRALKLDRGGRRPRSVPSSRACSAMSSGSTEWPRGGQKRGRP